ncbi:hypothetical protein ACFQQB_19790 [Nonomuraea rubra]|uniref:hypothetical protein n=1 Tax=Nonomuraea rubra TaxID=46180 RepID=UPI003621D6EC
MVGVGEQHVQPLGAASSSCRSAPVKRSSSERVWPNATCSEGEPHRLPPSTGSSSSASPGVEKLETCRPGRPVASRAASAESRGPQYVCRGAASPVSGSISTPTTYVEAGVVSAQWWSSSGITGIGVPRAGSIRRLETNPL